MNWNDSNSNSSSFVHTNRHLFPLPIQRVQPTQLRQAHISLALKQGWNIVAHPSLTFSLSRCFYSVNLPSSCLGSIDATSFSFPTPQVWFVCWLMNSLSVGSFGCDNKLWVAGTKPELPCPCVDSAGLHVDLLLKVSPTDFHCQSDDKEMIAQQWWLWNKIELFLPHSCHITVNSKITQSICLLLTQRQSQRKISETLW